MLAETNEMQPACGQMLGNETHDLAAPNGLNLASGVGHEAVPDFRENGPSPEGLACRRRTRLAQKGSLRKRTVHCMF